MKERTSFRILREIWDKKKTGCLGKRSPLSPRLRQPVEAGACSRERLSYLCLRVNGLVASSFVAFFRRFVGFLVAMWFLPVSDLPPWACTILICNAGANVNSAGRVRYPLLILT